MQEALFIVTASDYKAWKKPNSSILHPTRMHPPNHEVFLARESSAPIPAETAFGNCSLQHFAA